MGAGLFFVFMSAISTPLPTPTDNYETQIDTASVSASALSFDVTDANADTNLPSEFIGVLYQKDADGEVVAGSVEYIHVTGVSGQTISLTDINDRGLTGSDNGAQAYSQNDYFGIWVTSYYYDSLKSYAETNVSALDTSQSTGWVSYTTTCTYASATSFTVAGVDVTSIFQKGTKLKLTNDSSTKYFYVTSSSFSTDTTVNITGGTDYTLANSAITNVYYSYAENPQGFPDLFNYSPTYGGSGSLTFTSVSTDYSKFKIIGKTLHFWIKAIGTTGGTTSNTLYVSYPVTPASDVTSVSTAAVSYVADTSAVGGLSFNSSAGLAFRKVDAANWGLGTSRAISGYTTYEI